MTLPDAIIEGEGAVPARETSASSFGAEIPPISPLDFADFVRNSHIHLSLIDPPFALFRSLCQP